MIRTLVLTERPFRDLRSRALLLDLPALLGQATALYLSTAADNAPPGYQPAKPDVDPASLGVSRVILAGVFQERPQLDRALSIAAAAVATGALLELRRFGVERAAAHRTPPQGVAVLDRARHLEVRDHHTANALMVWRVAAPFRIDPYPERRLIADPALLDGLPPAPILGLAILGGPQMRAAWTERLDEMRGLLAPMQGWPILPLPSEHPDSPMDDLAGTEDFTGAMLPGTPLLLPRLADPAWRRRHLTPARLKSLVARCAIVVTNQDLPAAFAVACGVKLIGLALGTDRRAISCLTQFANDLAPGSALLHKPRV